MHHAVGNVSAYQRSGCGEHGVDQGCGGLVACAYRRCISHKKNMDVKLSILILRSYDFKILQA